MVSRFGSGSTRSSWNRTRTAKLYGGHFGPQPEKIKNMLEIRFPSHILEPKRTSFSRLWNESLDYILIVVFSVVLQYIFDIYKTHDLYQRDAMV
jgi:hypothetical protein